MSMTTTTTVYTKANALRRSPPVLVQEGEDIESSALYKDAAALGRSPPVMVREPKRVRAQFAESAGEKTAECAAVCCCFPVGLANLLVVVAVKLPTGLVRRAVRRHRIKHRLRNKPPLPLAKGRISGGNSEDEFGVQRLCADDDMWHEVTPSQEVMELEQAMWASFYDAGFWRSHSQNEEMVRFLPTSNAVEEEGK